MLQEKINYRDVRDMTCMSCSGQLFWYKKH